MDSVKYRLLMLFGLIIVALLLACPTPDGGGEDVVVTGVTIQATSDRIEKNSTLKLTADVEGTGNYDKTVSWSSSNSTIASVDETGLVEGVLVSEDPVTITATSNGDDSKRASVEIIVVPVISSVEIVGKPPEGVAVTLGTHHTFMAVVKDPDSATLDGISLVWSVEGTLPAGTTLNPDTGVLIAGNTEGTFDVVVKAVDKESVTDSVTVELYGTPSLLGIGIQHPGTSVGLLYNKDEALQMEFPSMGAVLDIKIPANYGGLALERCDTIFTATDGATVTVGSSSGDDTGGVSLTGGRGTLDFSSGSVEITVSRYDLTRSYTISAEMSDYAVIPDPLFRYYLQLNVAGAFEGELLDTTRTTVLEGVTEMNISIPTVASLEGVEFFPNLAVLICEQSELTALDVSKNIELTKLSCFDNKLTKLDVSKNIELTKLSCLNNKLAKLDVSKNTKLSELECTWNEIESLDLSSNTQLTSLSCGSTTLKSLDLSQNTALVSLTCAGGKFTSLDVSSNTLLESLLCRNLGLTSLDVSKNTRLKSLNCSNNNIESLDVSKNAALTTLECKENQLTRLDCSQNTLLTWMECNNNPLTYLDVSGMGENTRQIGIETDVPDNHPLVTFKINGVLKDELGDLLAQLGFTGEPVASGDNGEILTYTRTVS